MANKKTDVKVDNEVVGTLQEENVESQKVTKESEHDDAFVSLRHIDKIYDNNVQAVFDFNLDIKKHEFIVFVGPSGCGKSTTLRMIAGLEDITKGELYIDNELCNDKTPKDRDIAMVFQ
ncbi:MAG: ATP-binding cassette domain-containing protein, partial [Bacilli bacterium]|nr:ATP-binding cassette domain-containing protein [Bacilli bacterium]